MFIILFKMFLIQKMGLIKLLPSGQLILKYLLIKRVLLLLVVILLNLITGILMVKYKKISDFVLSLIFYVFKFMICFKC